MKVRLFFLVAFMSIFASATMAQVDVFFYDNSGSPTNIRNAPNGKIVETVPAGSDGMMIVENPKNGWWIICDNSFYQPDGGLYKLTGASNYYIHYSCIGVSTTNYGGQTLRLRSTPSKKGTVVYSFKEELILHPIDERNGWVKVKTSNGKYQGWIEKQWLCGNSVSNCN